MLPKIRALLPVSSLSLPELLLPLPPFPSPPSSGSGWHSVASAISSSGISELMNDFS